MKLLRLLFNLLCCLFIALPAYSQYHLLPAGAQDSDLAAAFATLENRFHHYVDEGVFAGVAMTLSRGDESFTDCYGLQNRETETRVRPNTIFRIASMTKPITSVAILMLVEANQLKLDDPVSRFIPAFGQSRVYRAENQTAALLTPLTIRHLLTHTGGISSGFDPSPAGKVLAAVLRERRPATLEELVLALADCPLAFQPGTSWVYSYSTDILAYIVEQVSGMPIERFFSEKIFGPLQMEDTAFQVPSDKVGRFATLYATAEGGSLQAADLPETSPYVRGGYYPRGNGGLISTIIDYHRFARMLLQGGELEGVRLLAPESVQLMTRNHLPAELLPIAVAGDTMEGQGFGLGVGIMLEDTPFGAAGDYFWPGATYTYFFVSPELQLIGIFMAQLSDMNRRGVLDEFHDLATSPFLKKVEQQGK